jgi:sugar lactone lactonase YvrE
MSRGGWLARARTAKPGSRAARPLVWLLAVGMAVAGAVAAGAGPAAASATVPPVNVFVASAATVGELPAGGGAPVTVLQGQGFSTGVAIDTQGDLFYTDWDQGQVDELPAGGGPAQALPFTGLSRPAAIAVEDTPGNYGTVFVADFFTGKVQYLMPDGQQGVVASGMVNPAGVAVSPAGDLYYSDPTAGTVIADPAFTGQLGLPSGVVASGLNPRGLAVDAAGNLFIASSAGPNDVNGSIVEVAAGTGKQTTVVSGLDDPAGVAVDGAGDLFITEGGVTGPYGLVEVPAGSSTQVSLDEPGPGPALEVAVPPAAQQVAFTSVAPVNPQVGSTYSLSAAGSLSGNPISYSIDPASSASACSATGSTVTFTGTGTCQVDATQEGSPPLYTQAPGVSQTVYPGEGPLQPPVDVFAAVTANARVVELPVTGGQTAVPATGLRNPRAVAIDAAGDVYIADASNGQVVELPAGGGAQVTVASGLSAPAGLALDAAGDLYIANSFASDILEVPAGGGVPVTVPFSGLSHPDGVALDAAGDLFAADAGNQRLVELPAGGGPQVTLLSGLPQINGVAADAAGDVFFSDTVTGTVSELPAGGSTPQVIANGLDNPAGLAVDNVGDVFIADADHGRIVEVAAGSGQLSYGGSGLGVTIGVAVPPPAAQQITFSSGLPPTAAVGGSATLTATGGGSGNPVTFSVDSSSSPSACTLSGPTVTFTGVGTCAIDANQAAGPGYLAAPQVTQSVLAGPGTIAVQATGSQTFGSASPGFSYSSRPPGGITVSGSLSCATVNGGAPISAALPGGTYTIDGSSCSGLSPSDANDYTLRYQGAAGQFVVSPAGQVVTWSPVPETGFGDAPFSVTGFASATSGGALTFSGSGPCTVTPDGTVTGTGSGTCFLTAAQAGDNDYLAATATTALTISPVGLAASSSGVQAGQKVSLTAQVATDVSATRAKLVLIDQNTGTVIKSCASGTACTASAANPAGSHTYVAELVTTAGVVTAASPIVPVVWAAPTVAVAASPASPEAGQKTAVTATASESMTGNPLSIEIYDPSTGTVLKSCPNGTVCTLRTAAAGGTTSTFAAAIVYAGVQVQLGAPPTVTVSWG